MPTYEIGLDDGRTLHIDADDQNAALAGAQHIIGTSAQGQAPTEQPSVTTDIAKQLASGVAEAPENLLATPARISGLVDRGINWAVHKVAPDSALDRAGQDIVSRDDALSNSIYNAVPAPSKFLPQPETTAGQYARTVGNMLPTAAVGPGSMLTRLVTQ